jgi:hypothetical protein
MGNRRPCAFKEADLKRALCAAKNAGFNVAGFTVDSEGNISVQIAKPADGDLNKPNRHEWDNIQ